MQRRLVCAHDLCVADIFKMSATHILKMSNDILNAQLDMSGARFEKCRHLEVAV